MRTTVYLNVENWVFAELTVWVVMIAGKVLRKVEARRRVGMRRYMIWLKGYIVTSLSCRAVSACKFLAIIFNHELLVGVLDFGW